MIAEKQMERRRTKKIRDERGMGPQKPAAEMSGTAQSVMFFYPMFFLFSLSPPLSISSCMPLLVGHLSLCLQKGFWTLFPSSGFAKLGVFWFFAFVRKNQENQINIFAFGFVGQRKNPIIFNGFWFSFHCLLSSVEKTHFCLQWKMKTNFFFFIFFFWHWIWYMFSLWRKKGKCMVADLTCWWVLGPMLLLFCAWRKNSCFAIKEQKRKTVFLFMGFGFYRLGGKGCNYS